MSVSVEQAGINALKTYLASQIPGVTINEVWPNPDADLPERVITIVKIGAREETKIDPKVVASAPVMIPGSPDPLVLVEDPVNRSFTWCVKLVRQSIQLDVWSCYQAVRDDLHAQLDEALNLGPAITLGSLMPLSDPFRDGLLLALGDGRPGFADVRFDGPEIDDTPESVQKNEFRATRFGTIDVPLTITRTQPRMAQVSMTVTTATGLHITAGNATDIFLP
jgi:hypothetical protein